MASYPSFNVGEDFTSADANAIGLWLVKTQTIGTAVSSVSVSNAFSVTFDQYLITASGGTTTSSSAYLNLSFNGAVGNNYRYQYLYGTWTSAVYSTGATGAANIPIVGNMYSNGISAMITVSSPFLSAPTYVRAEASALSSFTSWTAGFWPLTDSFTGFTLTSGGGTMTGGTIRVYGYRL